MGIFATSVTASMLLILARKSNIAARRRETEALETSVKSFSKSALVLLALAVAGTPARSRSLHIAGTAGYLSEWEFDGEVAETAIGGELVGPLVWKHIGLCSVNGPISCHPTGASRYGAGQIFLCLWYTA